MVFSKLKLVPKIPSGQHIKILNAVSILLTSFALAFSAAQHGTGK